MFKSLLRRGFFFKVLLSIIFFIFVLPINIKPVYAFSTIDACMRNPKCAAPFLAESGAKSVLKKKASELVVNNATKTTINLTKNTVARTSISSYGSKIFTFGLGSYIAEKIFGHLIDDGINAVQEKIKNYYCETISSSYCGISGVKITAYVTGFNEGYRYYYSSRTIGFEEGNVVDNGEGAFQRYISNLPSGYDSYKVLSEDANGEFYLSGGGGNAYWSATEPEFEPFNVGGVDWDDWEEGEKDKAIDKYMDEKLEELFDDLVETTPVNHPEIEPGDRVQIDTDKHPNENGDGFDDGDDNFTEGNESGDDEEPPPSKEKCQSLNGGTCEEPPPENEEEEEENSEDCIECKEITFTEQNFFQYAQSKFINQPKFPFDIFGDLPSAGSANECPTVAMFNRSKEMCFINDSLGVMKYPVWISWLIKLALSI